MFLHLCRARRIISFHCGAAAVQKVSDLGQPQLNLVLCPMNFDLARRGESEFSLRVSRGSFIYQNKPILFQ
jgi:hypothetical protein